MMMMMMKMMMMMMMMILTMTIIGRTIIETNLPWHSTKACNKYNKLQLSDQQYFSVKTTLTRLYKLFLFICAV